MRGICVGTSVAGIVVICARSSVSFQAPPCTAYASHNVRHNQRRARRRRRPGSPMGWLASSRSVNVASAGDEDDEKRPTFVVSGPTRLQDYEDVGRLLVDSFDAMAKPQSSSGLMINELLWNVGITKAWIAQQYTNRYISNSRKMRGKKFSLLVAKSYGTTADNADDGENNQNGIRIVPGQVIGVAEVGVSRYSIISGNNTTSSSSSSSDRTTDVVASIGVICVQNSQRGTGVGSELLAASESIVRSRWHEASLYAAVEESNGGALRFFHEEGYENSGLVVEVEVAERMSREKRPHLLLAKRLVDYDGD